VLVIGEEGKRRDIIIALATKERRTDKNFLADAEFGGGDILE